MNSPALIATALCFGRRNRPILEEVAISLSPGEIVGLIGPNGSGKSTLLRCLAGALVPHSGNVVYGSQSLLKQGATERAKILSYSPQDTPYAFAFTVREFIGLSRDMTVPSADNERDILELLDNLDLTGLAHRSLLTLSGGERQRAAVARAIVQRTPFVFLDEPTSHLDLRHQRLLLEVLRREATEKQRGILVVLHDLNLAAAVADRLYLLQAGKIFAKGTVSEVITPEIITHVYGTNIQLLQLANEKRAVFLSY